MKKRMLFYFLTFTFTLMFSACSKEEINSLRLAVVQWNGYAPLYVAEHENKLPQNLHIIDYASNYDIVEDLKAGRLEAAFLTLDEVCELKKDGVDIRVIYAIDTSNGADAILAKQTIQKVQDLKDKKVVYEPGSVQEYLLFRALEKNGMGLKDIKSVLVKFDQQNNLDVQKDNFDAVVTFEPLKSKLLKGGLHTLFSSKDIPNEIVDLLVVTKDAMLQNKRDLKELLKALSQATVRIKKDTATDTVVAEYLHTTPQDVRNSYKEIKLLSLKENQQLFDKNNAILLKDIEHIHHYHQIEHNHADDEKIFDNSLLLEVMR